jgi:hypothetical protein
MIDWQDIRVGTFDCPVCGWGVCIPMWYRRLFGILTMVLDVIICYLLLGVGVAFFVAAVVGLFPLACVVVFVTLSFVPPRLQFSDDYMLRLYDSGRPASPRSSNGDEGNAG